MSVDEIIIGFYSDFVTNTESELISRGYDPDKIFEKKMLLLEQYAGDGKEPSKISCFYVNYIAYLIPMMRK